MIGLKENVIIGKLIPAGTGMKRYRNVRLDSDMNEELMVSEDIEENVETEEIEIDYEDELFDIPEEDLSEEDLFIDEELALQDEDW